MQAQAEDFKLHPLPPGTVLRLLWGRLPKGGGLWPGRLRRLASLMAFDEEAVRALLEGSAPAWALEYQVRTVQASSGDHYLVPLYRWGRKVAEAWVPAATVGPRDVIPSFRVFPEVRPLAGPKAALRAHGDLDVPSEPKPRLYWLATERFPPTPFFGWEGEGGLWLLEARLPSRLAFRAVRLPENQDSSAYQYRGRPIRLDPLTP